MRMPKCVKSTSHTSLFAAELHDNSYACYRVCACAGIGAAFYGIGALAALPYALCGGSFRKEEAQKTHMYLTRSAIVFDRYVYVCGCCCYKQVRICTDWVTLSPLKALHFIWLDSVAGAQDGAPGESAGCCFICQLYVLHALVSAVAIPSASRAGVCRLRRLLWLCTPRHKVLQAGDPNGACPVAAPAVCCTIRIRSTQAGSSGPKQTGAEIQAVALADPEAFRSAVLAARRILNGRGTEADKELLQYPEAVFGEGKTAGDSAAVLGAAAAGSSLAAGDAKVVALLERIGGLLEQVVENGSTGSK